MEDKEKTKKSCGLNVSLTPEEYENVTDLFFFACTKSRKIMTKSDVMRALIRFGVKHKDVIEF